MDKDLGRNSERQLFHGTDAKNVSHINTQGFNRSLCGAHGKWLDQIIALVMEQAFKLSLETKGYQGPKRKE